MHTSVTLKVILIFAGLVGLLVGAGMLFAPVPFHASAGIVLDDSTNLLSEMRASGGVVLASALVILSGAFVARLAFTATLIATLMYLSYGVSRLISIAVDGMPDIAILQIAAAELVVGLICGAALIGLLGYRFQD
ncbi:MAG: DUF4345 domain-containing protein [Hyphomonas sp.]|nr:DUF4345 domain-containing protein [Hyphomonas sp.]